MSNLTLFNLGDEIKELESRLTDIEGEINDDDQERIIDQWLEQLASNKDKLNVKLDGYVTLIREVEARSTMRKQESQRLAIRASVDMNLADRLKARLKAFFELHEISKMETPHNTISLANNGGKQPLVIRVSVNDLPSEYKKTEIVVTADKDKIRQDLEIGTKLEFAELLPRGRNIRIK